MKRDKLLMHAIIWMNLKTIVLKESSQTQKATEHMLPFYYTIENAIQ